VISARAGQSQPHGYRIFAGDAIGFHVADIVYIEDRDSEQPTGSGRQQNRPGNKTCLDKVAADDADPTKKGKYGDVAQTGITVWHLPGSIRDCRPDCGRAEKDKNDS